MLVLFSSIHVETLVPLCLTAGLRGLQEAALRRAADGGRCQLGREEATICQSPGPRPHLPLLWPWIPVSPLVISCRDLRASWVNVFWLEVFSQPLVVCQHQQIVPNSTSKMLRPVNNHSGCFLYAASELSNIYVKLVGSRIVPGNLKWLIYVHSTVISVHCRSDRFLCSLSAPHFWVVCKALCATVRESSRVAHQPHGLKHTPKKKERSVNALWSGWQCVAAAAAVSKRPLRPASVTESRRHGWRRFKSKLWLTYGLFSHFRIMAVAFRDCSLVANSAESFLKGGGGWKRLPVDSCPSVRLNLLVAVIPK